MKLRLIALAALALAACAPPREPQVPPAPAVETPAPPPAEAAPKPEAAAVPARPRTPLELYKEDVAKHLAARSAERVYAEPPPHFLRSIVVLQVAVDRQGTVTAVKTLRTNGYKDLEQAAHRSVRAAAPLPAPPAALVRAGHVEFTETWLFRDDGRFQLRSLAAGEQGDPQKGWDQPRR
ncbi:MAG: energy transducer TonB [Burkholderiales bacterium]|nr:energy transducer TonB [Burkholderiales bacterium]